MGAKNAAWLPTAPSQRWESILPERVYPVFSPRDFISARPGRFPFPPGGAAGPAGHRALVSPGQCGWEEPPGRAVGVRPSVRPAPRQRGRPSRPCGLGGLYRPRVTVLRRLLSAPSRHLNLGYQGARVVKVTVIWSEMLCCRGSICLQMLKVCMLLEYSDFNP